MVDIIEKVPRELITAELSEDNRFLRKTNFGENEIYVLNYHNSPNTMREVGRLREIAFRGAGGGTGKELDIDHFDTRDIPYEQLIVWDPESQEILGGYRFLHIGELLKSKDDIDIATTRLFHVSDQFIKEYAPFTIELGRSFIQPLYQASKIQSKSRYILDNLWDGLGALIKSHDNVKYFFGKITMYTHFHTKARDLILYFFEKYFDDKEKLVFPKEMLELETPIQDLENIFSANNYKDDYKILSAKVRELGENIPPLFNAYMKLSPTMKIFGTSKNKHFGGVEETGLMITIEDIYESKKIRHLEGF